MCSATAVFKTKAQNSLAKQHNRFSSAIWSLQGRYKEQIEHCATHRFTVLTVMPTSVTVVHLARANTTNGSPIFLHLQGRKAYIPPTVSIDRQACEIFLLGCLCVFVYSPRLRRSFPRTLTVLQPHKTKGEWNYDSQLYDQATCQHGRMNALKRHHRQYQWLNAYFVQTCVFDTFSYGVDAKLVVKANMINASGARLDVYSMRSKEDCYLVKCSFNFLTTDNRCDVIRWWVTWRENSAKH